MIKKFVFILFFFICYLTYGTPSFAETTITNMNKEVEVNDGKAKPDNVKNNRPKKENKSDTKGQLKEKKEEKIVESELEPESLEDDLNCTKDMQYTEAQKKRLDQIYHRIYTDYQDLIETYAWAGALTEEQKLVRHSMLKNYILTFAKRNYKWCSEWAEDEWEEEWFNIDRD